MNIVPQDFVTVASTGVMTDSRTVAKHFKKRHADVLRAAGKVECSAEFNERNFASIDYIDSRGRAKREVRMTKDGFMFLVMGFTGREAARIKEAFIAAFNRMAEHIRTQAAESYERYAAAVQEFVAAKSEASGFGRGLNGWRLRKPKLEMRVIQSRPHQFALAFG